MEPVLCYESAVALHRSPGYLLCIGELSRQAVLKLEKRYLTIGPHDVAGKTEPCRRLPRPEFAQRRVSAL